MSCWTRIGESSHRKLSLCRACWAGGAHARSLHLQRPVVVTSPYRVPHPSCWKSTLAVSTSRGALPSRSIDTHQSMIVRIAKFLILDIPSVLMPSPHALVRGVVAPDAISPGHLDGTLGTEPLRVWRVSRSSSATT